MVRRMWRRGRGRRSGVALTPRDQMILLLAAGVVAVFVVMRLRRDGPWRAHWDDLFSRSRSCDHHLAAESAIERRGMFHRNSWVEYGVLRIDHGHLTIHVPGQVGGGWYCLERHEVDGLTRRRRGMGHEYQFVRTGDSVPGVAFVRLWEDHELAHAIEHLGWMVPIDAHDPPVGGAG